MTSLTKQPPIKKEKQKKYKTIWKEGKNNQPHNPLYTHMPTYTHAFIIQTQFLQICNLQLWSRVGGPSRRWWRPWWRWLSCPPPPLTWEPLWVSPWCRGRTWCWRSRVSGPCLQRVWPVRSYSEWRVRMHKINTQIQTHNTLSVNDKWSHHLWGSRGLSKKLKIKSW